MLTARKIAQIGTCPGWCCRGGSVGRMGGAAVPHFGHHRRRIGFSSRYTTNGPQILRRSVAVGWLVGMAASVRLVDQGARFGPRRIQFCCFAVCAWVEATRLVLFYGGLNFLSLTPTASSAVFSYFHLTANNRRTPCLRQHCRCQRWRQGYPGHWRRCRCSGKPSGRLFACVTFVKVWDCETEHGKATQCHGHSRRACSRQCNQALEGSNCDRDTHSLIVYGRTIGAQ